MNAPHDSNPTTLDFSEKEIFLWNPHNRARLTGTMRQKMTAKRFFEYLPYLVRKNRLIAIGLLIVLVVTSVHEITGSYLYHFGIRATGVVTSRDTSQTRGRGGTRTTYYLTYRYRTQGNQSYSNKHAVGVDIFNRYGEQMDIPILYDRNNPSLSLPVDIAGKFPFITFGSVVAIAVIGWITWNNYRNATLLTSKGRLIEGEVVSCATERKSNKYGPFVEVNLHYSFYTPDEQLHSGHNQKDMTVADFESFVCPEAGISVAVLYHDERTFTLL